MKQKNLFEGYNIDDDIENLNPEMMMPDGKKFHIFEQVPEEAVKYFKDCISYISDGKFHTGQSCNEKPAKTVKCNICGGSEFYVGKDDFWTGISCIKCGWEKGIHNG